MLGFVGGYFSGKWESRKSDLLIFEELGTGIAALFQILKAELEQEEIPEDEEIVKAKDELFSGHLDKIRNEGKKSGRFAWLILVSSVGIFLLSQIVDG